MIIEDFENAGHDFAYAEYHGSDDYATTESENRLTWYNCEYYPETWIDGQQIPIDNFADAAMMLDWYNTRMATPSNFSIGVSQTHVGLDYSATITLTKEADFTNTNLVLRVVLVESHIPEAWQTLDELNYVARDMIPDENGTTVSFAGGDIQTFNFDFTMNAGWDKDNSQLIAFLQDEDTKEVLQTEVVTLASPDYTTDAQLFSIISPSGNFCGESLIPEIRIKNKGADNLTSLDISYSINGGTVENYSWTGDLPFNSVETVVLPAIVFTSTLDNTITVTCSNPNGISDENAANNEVTGSFQVLSYLTETLTFELLTDAYGSESSWEFRNSTGTVIASGTGYASNTYYTEDITVPANGCYIFAMLDSYGDGIYDPSYYRLKDQAGNIIVEGGVDVGSEELTNFYVDINVSVKENQNSNIGVYPVPSSGIININHVGCDQMTIYNAIGSVIYNRMTENGITTIDLSAYPEGTYLLKIEMTDKVVTKKILITR